MILSGRTAKILLIDTNVYFSKRLSDALKREGFEVNCSTQPSFALTTLEYDSPTAIVCSTNMREMGALDIARLVRADVKNSTLPIIALGDGSQRALMEAFQAGCDDYIDRNRPPAVLAAHIRNIIISKAEGFQPTQMLPQADTSLSGSLTHHDLPGVMQMLGHAHQTGALHINSGSTDALLFFDAGEIVHAECGTLFGDEAVIQILKSCMKNNSGVYKFVYGSASAQRTVLRSATDLMLDAMREIDESAHAADVPAPAEISPVDAFSEPAGQAFEDPAPEPAPDDSPYASSLGPADVGIASSEEHSAIATSIDHFAASTPATLPEQARTPVLSDSSTAKLLTADSSESPGGTRSVEPNANAEPSAPHRQLDEKVVEPSVKPSANSNGLPHQTEAEPFANYSIVPFAGPDEHNSEDNP